MKLIHTKRLFAITLLNLVMVYCLNAQEFKKTESIRTQFVNNSVPGLNYAPANSATEPVKTKPFTGSSLAHEMRTVGLPGTKLKQGQATQAAVANKPAGENKIPLPSEMSAAQAKAIADKIALEEAAKKINPPSMQVEEKKETEVPAKEN